MKTTLKTLAVGLILLATVASSTADGLINFFTFNANPAFGKLYIGNIDNPFGTIPMSGPQFKGQLMGGTSTGSLAPIGSATAFLTGAGAGIINFGNVTVSGIEAGTPYFYALRAWDGVSFFNPLSFSYQTESVHIILGGTTSTGAFFATPQANGFLSNVPEPTTLTLAGLGLAALFVAHRRKRDIL